MYRVYYLLYCVAGIFDLLLRIRRICIRQKKGEFESISNGSHRNLNNKMRNNNYCPPATLKRKYQYYHY